MASPQTENGYTRIADEILENIIRFDFNKTETKIIILLIRLTYGFNRKTANMALSFIAEITGLYKGTIQRNLDRLIKDKIILITKKSTNNTARNFAFNKNYEKWKRKPNTNYAKLSGVLNSKYSKKSRVLKNEYPGVLKSKYSGVLKNEYQERELKDIYKDNHDGGENLGQIAQAYTKYIGMDNISKFREIHTYKDDMDIDVIIEAIKRTNKRNKKSNYCLGILRNWLSKDVRTMEDVERLDKEFNNGVMTDDERDEKLEKMKKLNERGF